MAQTKTSGRSGAKRGELEARQAVVATALAMSRQKLSPGRSGNVSMRFGEGMLITPSGMAYDEIGPDDIAYMAHDGSVRIGSRKPSSEWHFHLAAYAARPDRNALVHTHSLNATVLACAHRGIPAFHYMVAAAGGTDIPLVPYATFGTQELAVLVAKGVAVRDACLMANHGVVALGVDLAAALELASEVELLAEQYLKVLSVGPAHVLSEAEMAVVLDKFKSYGQKAQG
ncbi:MAG: class II aldolase/adducin family protein [Hyphomicrobiaceae bacterium]